MDSDDLGDHSQFMSVGLLHCDEQDMDVDSGVGMWMERANHCRCKLLRASWDWCIAHYHNHKRATPGIPGRKHDEHLQVHCKPTDRLPNVVHCVVDFNQPF